MPDLARIADAVQSSGLPRPCSSGDREITVCNPRKRTVYVGRLVRERAHASGRPWYIQWGRFGTSERKQHHFVTPDEVIGWLQRDA